MFLFYKCGLKCGKSVELLIVISGTRTVSIYIFQDIIFQDGICILKHTSLITQALINYSNAYFFWLK